MSSRLEGGGRDNLPPPVWQQHGLCRDDQGRRLAKRQGAATIRSLRERGHTPEQVLAMARPSIAPSP